MAYSLVHSPLNDTLKRNRRMYHRLMTGTQIREYRNQPMRFLTLTSAKEGVYYMGRDGQSKIRTIKQSWAALRKRIHKTFGWKLNKYFCLRTSEGNGVLHIVFWGGQYIPYEWLSENWKQIHGAWNISIEFVHQKKKTVTGLVGYLLDRYLLNQPIKRMSYGWGWAWLGFCKSWKNVKLTYNMMRCGQATYENGKLVNDQNHDGYEFQTGQPKVFNYVPFKKRFKYQAVKAWKSNLQMYRVTSRQTKILKFT